MKPRDGSEEISECEALRISVWNSFAFLSFDSLFFRLPLIYCRTSRVRATPSSTVSCPRSSASLSAQPAASTAAAAHAWKTGSGNGTSPGYRTMIWTVRAWLPMATTPWRAQSWTARKMPLWRHFNLVTMVDCQLLINYVVYFIHGRFGKSTSMVRKM